MSLFAKAVPHCSPMVQVNLFLAVLKNKFAKAQQLFSKVCCARCAVNPLRNLPASPAPAKLVPWTWMPLPNASRW